MSNITIRVDDAELVRRAKILAAQQGTSVSALVRQYLEDLVLRDDRYEQASAAAARDMHGGLRLGGRPLTRDEAHDDG